MQDRSLLQEVRRLLPNICSADSKAVVRITGDSVIVDVPGAEICLLRDKELDQIISKMCKSKPT